MSNQMALWNQVCVTDPKHVKAITGKDYSGNSPKPYWIVQRLTEVFGPCGIGWGYTIESERFHKFSDTDTLHIAKVVLWYALDGLRGTVEQMGQTKASYVTSSGKFRIDEDAPKKSVTDALVKCASYLGFAGDIFSGRWDDSKYVEQAGATWAARRALQSGDEHWCVAALKKIADASDMLALKHAFDEAIAQAKAADDADAKETIVSAKDKRKAELAPVADVLDGVAE